MLAQDNHGSIAQHWQKMMFVTFVWLMMFVTFVCLIPPLFFCLCRLKMCTSFTHSILGDRCGFMIHWLQLWCCEYLTPVLISSCLHLYLGLFSSLAGLTCFCVNTYFFGFPFGLYGQVFHDQQLGCLLTHTDIISV